MSNSIEHTIERQTASYEKTMRSVAARNHIDLAELRRATKYAGRNINGMHASLREGMLTVVLAEQDAATARDRINLNLGNLIAVTTVGFALTLRQLQNISDQLEQITQILARWDDSKAAAKREKGIYLAGKGRIMLAVEHMKAAIDLNVTDFVAFYALGVLYATSQQLEVAAGFFENCALYADQNPAMGAEAAILAAHCYDQEEASQSAWRVLSSAIRYHCPDLALPLMKHAQEPDQLKLAKSEIAKAFMIDAELALVAEEMELPDIDSTAQQADHTIRKQVQELLSAWDRLNKIRRSAGLTIQHTRPAVPRHVSARRVNLLNDAICRRRIQSSLINMLEETQERLSTNMPYDEVLERERHPERPWRPWGSVLLLGVCGLLAVIASSHHSGFWLMVGLVTAVIIAALQPMKWRRYFEARDEYEKRVRQADQAKDQRVRYERHKAELEAECYRTREVLEATIPPAVPRAFASDLSAYQSYGRPSI
jgi:tetratricopeptide (TPR) repeat protein